MMTAFLLSILALGAVAYGMLYERRLRNDRQLLKTEIRKWEDEGGNVPEVPAMTPAVKPGTSAPPRR